MPLRLHIDEHVKPGVVQAVRKVAESVTCDQQIRVYLTSASYIYHDGKRCFGLFSYSSQSACIYLAAAPRRMRATILATFAHELAHLADWLRGKEPTEHGADWSAAKRLAEHIPE
jgi:hypothetical protein